MNAYSSTEILLNSYWLFEVLDFKQLSLILDNDVSTRTNDDVSRAHCFHRFGKFVRKLCSFCSA